MKNLEKCRSTYEKRLIYIYIYENILIKQMCTVGGKNGHEEKGACNSQ